MTDYSVLGLCRRAGKLAIGRDATVDSVRNGKAYLVIITSDASPRHEKEIRAIGYEGNILAVEGTMDEVGYACGKRSCVFAVTDKGFADSIYKKLKIND